MTAGRRKRKQSGARPAVAALAAFALIAVSVVAARAQDGLTGRIVVDWHTGLAIDGYDPVAFFTDGKPRSGNPDFELRYGGAVWRFCNFGNKAAFAEHPDIYMPQFGGYDPVSVAQGVAVPGNPDIWLIVGERLFLFYDAAQRNKFSADSAHLLASAKRKWPALEATLDP
jgi:YHS domain-containing protein